MVDICPTVLADSNESYDQQLERLSSFVERLHIDIVDGQFAPARTIAIDQIWWPGGVRTDLHVMYKQPFEYTEALVAMQPALIIVHAEADGDFVHFAETLHHHGIESGVALLPETAVDSIKPALALIDHVLIFSGKLGHFGGHADLKLLDKVRALKALKPQLEIGWDGGVNDQNAPELARGGVEVLNAGGFLHGSQAPAEAYAALKAAVKGAKADA